LICGVDDAGRKWGQSHFPIGPVIGPLVIAGVLIRDDQVAALKALGVKDSKLLSPQRREKLAEEIAKFAVQCEIVELSPAEIDKIVLTGKKFHKLNLLEAKAMADVIKRLKPEIAYVDASDVMAERFGSQIKEMLPFPVTIISEHKADVTYPVVSAASIIAKVRRDKIIAQLHEKYGDFGSGYITDSKTVAFLIDWIKRYGSYPDFVRKSWKPAKRMREKAEGTQTHL